MKWFYRLIGRNLTTRVVEWNPSDISLMLNGEVSVGGTAKKLENKYETWKTYFKRMLK